MQMIWTLALPDRDVIVDETASHADLVAALEFVKSERAKLASSPASEEHVRMAECMGEILKAMKRKPHIIRHAAKA